MEEIEEEAKAAAEKMVMNMMQRPGQLEKVKPTYLRNKFIIDPYRPGGVTA